MDRTLAEVSSAPSPERLTALLSPRSVAIVGASDRLGWSSGAFANFAGLGFDGALHLVNRNGGVVHGRETVTSCVEIGEPVDLAIMLVGARSLAPALEDVAAAGIPHAVVLAAGFGETGEHGVGLQQELVELCRELDVTCVGPNCLGFVNVVDRAPAWAGMMPVRLISGAVAIVSQSGATASEIATYAATQNIGLSHIISTGNEAMVDAIAMSSAVLEDERVRALAIFTESIRDAQRFRALAARAAELEKPIVMMKVGTSALAAEIALTHTGALVGDDRLVDAALRQSGVVRVALAGRAGDHGRAARADRPAVAGRSRHRLDLGRRLRHHRRPRRARRAAAAGARPDHADSPPGTDPRVRHAAQSARHHRCGVREPAALRRRAAGDGGRSVGRRGRRRSTSCRRKDEPSASSRGSS